MAGRPSIEGGGFGSRLLNTINNKATDLRRKSTFFRRAESAASRPATRVGRLATLYSAEDLAEYDAVFRIFDTDSSGSIGVAELSRAMASLGLEASEGELDALIREVDEDGNGEIDFEEFCSCMKRVSVKKASWEDVIRQCFEAFDHDGTGTIQQADFRFVFKSIGHFTDDGIIEDIFRETDVDGNGVIDATEFAVLVRSYLTDEDIQ